ISTSCGLSNRATLFRKHLPITIAPLQPIASCGTPRKCAGLAENRALSVLLEGHLILIPHGKYWILDGPVDRNIGVIPNDAALCFGCIESRLLVLNFANLG